MNHADGLSLHRPPFTQLFRPCAVGCAFPWVACRLRVIGVYHGWPRTMCHLYSATISITPEPVMSPNVAVTRTWPTATASNDAVASAVADALA